MFSRPIKYLKIIHTVWIFFLWIIALSFLSVHSIIYPAPRSITSLSAALHYEHLTDVHNDYPCVTADIFLLLHSRSVTWFPIDTTDLSFICRLPLATKHPTLISLQGVYI